MSDGRLDAIVVGAGPNGLAAAIALAREGHAVRVYEAAATVGGGARSAELTLPGFVHDPCASVHPLSLASPFLRSLDLERHGLEWVHPDAPLAHALAPDRTVMLPRSLDDRALDEALGRDAGAWRRLFGPLAGEWDRLVPMLLRPVLRPPRHPVLLARFGLPGLLSAVALARLAFRDPAARALLAGMSAHSMLSLRAPLSGSFALVLGLLAHGVGWPVARGGSGAIARALEAEARARGVELVTGHPVASLRDLPPSRAVLLDLTPRQVLAVAGDRLPKGYRKRLERYRYGMGVFKVDWALSGPIPWRAEACHRAGTIHLGGTLEEIAATERQTWDGGHPDRPFVLLAQPTLFDPSRAPAGKHIAWAYCHVPHASTVDMTDRIEAQVERFAPGFRDLILAKHTMGPAEMERRNPNYVGGDINGGVQDLGQLFSRPVLSFDPYATPADGLYICSSSTPPGGGVHGLCGYFAARSALRFLAKRRT